VFRAYRTRVSWWGVQRGYAHIAIQQPKRRQSTSRPFHLSRDLAASSSSPYVPCPRRNRKTYAPTCIHVFPMRYTRSPLPDTPNDGTSFQLNVNISEACEQGYLHPAEYKYGCVRETSDGRSNQWTERGHGAVMMMRVIVELGSQATASTPAKKKVG
jgi:hypothetical protein